LQVSLTLATADLRQAPNCPPLRSPLHTVAEASNPPSPASAGSPANKDCARVSRRPDGQMRQRA
jgi:hypothetical protein